MGGLFRPFIPLATWLEWNNCCFAYWRNMDDKYVSFQELERAERRGVYCVLSRPRKATIAVIAPHGGKIEPGTSEVARKIAGADFSFYAFEGRKKKGNKSLHITSTRFDEPICLALVRAAECIIAIHGENSNEKVVFLGGRDAAKVRRLGEVLEQRGFCVKAHKSARLQGTSLANICNRGRARAGVQIELTNGLRRSFFRSLSSEGRKTPTRVLGEFVSAVREVLHGV
jgi:phage replication-related protein YjqB (UPF0714/DUF867 family)